MTGTAINIPFVALETFEEKVKRAVFNEEGKQTGVKSALSAYVEGMSYTFRGDPEFRKQLKTWQKDGKVIVHGVI